ncbi:hypothetical protein ACFCWG_22260 [Streptomyces sp. NPDC056390]|uniref:hypothetical protein n=1 Tax=Streptomyces sp. NPDC056390 TaxID=3345806 RepID=UPI0035E2160B
MTTEAANPSDERTIAGDRVLQIDADKNPEEYKLARLRLLLIDLETAHESGDLLRTLGRADYLRESCLGLFNALTLRARQPDACGKAPHTLEQVGRVLGLSKQAVTDRVRALDPSAPLAVTSLVASTGMESVPAGGSSG